MSRALIIHRIGPLASIQDLGREGYLAQGLPRGGAADRHALIEGAALLGQSHELAALEMPGMGGSFEVTEPTRFALTGAPMRARIGQRQLQWNASGELQPGEKLDIGSCEHGQFGYLSLAGGIDTAPILGSRAQHISCGIGKALEAGERLPIGADKASKPDAASFLPISSPAKSLTIRFVSGPQTDLFKAETRERFTHTSFHRDLRGNRQGAQINFEGDAFTADSQLAILSEAITPGDIQMAGTGIPYILGPECQTVGGYPRIGTVIPADLGKFLQADQSVELHFEEVSLAEALAIDASPKEIYKQARKRMAPIIRDPRDIPNLLAYQLISGAITGWEE